MVDCSVKHVDIRIVKRSKIMQKITNKICHFRPSNRNISACGINNPKIAAYDGRDVTCFRCKKTKAYRTYMGLDTDRRTNVFK